MASGWACTVDGDVTMTFQSRFYLNGSEVILPAGFEINIVTEGRHVRATIEHDGKFWSLVDGLKLAQKAGSR